MKIAVIAPTEIPARRANTVQVMKMAQAFAGLGHTVRLVAPAAGPAPANSWEELAMHYGLVHPFKVDSLPAIPWLRRYDYAWRALRWAGGWKADLVYTRLPQAAALAGIQAVPAILELHDLPQGLMGSRLFRRFLHGRQSRRLVIITRSLEQDLSRRFDLGVGSRPPGFVVIAPDGVDLERYQDLPEPAQARRDLPLPLPEKFTAGYTGHLYAGRGTEILLGLAQRLPEITLLLVGGEPKDVARLQAQAQLAGLNNTVFTGFVPNAELPRYQAACDVLLMPYQQHVAGSSGGDIARYLSPMKLFEYMACGRPILSSDLPVLQEVLNADNARLLPADDLDAWVAALQQLAASSETCRRYAAQARRDVAAYTWERRAARILEGI
jgi:glycosyltransferase involved in cell wall biosynthesis